MIIRQHAHFLADDAGYNADGTFWVKRAGITDMNSAGWPAGARFYLVTRLELDVEAAAQLHHLSVRVWHSEAGEITSWKQPVAAKVTDATRSTYINLQTLLQFAVPSPGVIGIAAAIDDIQLPIVRLVAVTNPNAPRSPFVPQIVPPFKTHGSGKRRRPKTR